MHGCVGYEGVLVHEVLAADFAGELHLPMVAFRVPFHVRGVYPHEAALTTRTCLRRVGLFHVSIQHELLRICFSTGGAFEGPVDTVDDPQVRHQSRHEVKLFLTKVADLLVPFESAKFGWKSKFLLRLFPCPRRDNTICQPIFI